MTVTKITDPADAKAPWGGPPSHYAALEVTLKQTVTATPAAINSSCFTATGTDGQPAKVMTGYTADGGTAINGTLTQGAPVSGQVIVELPEDGSLKSLVAKCDNKSQDQVTVPIG